MRHRVDLRCTKIPIKSDLDGFRVRSASLSTTQITTMPQIPLIKIATVEGYKVYGGVWVILLILAFVSGIYTYTFPTTSCVPLNSPHNVSETIDLLSYEWAEEEKSVRNARIVVESKLLPVIFGMAAFVAFLPEFILFWLWLTWNAVEYWEFCFLRFLAAVLNLLMPIIIAISLAQHFKFADFPTELLLPVAANITYLLKSGVQEYECILNANKINNSAIFYVISIQSVYGLWCLFLAFSAYMLMRVIDVPRSRRSIVARFLHWITNLDLAVQGGSCNLTSDRPISAALPGSHIMERVPPYFLPRLLFRYASSEMHLSSLLNRSAGETTTPGPSERRSQLIMAEHRIEYQLGNGDTAVALAGFADDLSPGRLKASKTIRGSPKVILTVAFPSETYYKKQLHFHRESSHGPGSLGGLALASKKLGLNAEHITATSTIATQNTRKRITWLWWWRGHMRTCQWMSRLWRIEAARLSPNTNGTCQIWNLFWIAARSHTRSRASK
ncbi:hypothetical protein QR680_003891 [Steinernema hermaphroditum]|uniref:Uncharacterized protein n=1 Tax=Steinernema hermaphroditum TaxID=289476 RepID=A0AA39LSC3_9BILA|nr:hypothetical protein QR680_003891 [Steinernema hermaphroditum]